MGLPDTGMASDEIFEQMERLRTGDVRWREGRAFSLAYSAGPETLHVAEEAYRRFSGENALNTDAFPSLRTMQSDVVAAVSEWLAAPAGAGGFMTSGGTESVLMAVKAARERGRRLGIEHPNVVLPTSAHAAFEKGCQYFGVESRRVAVSDDWRADAGAMEATIDDHTVLVVASAPQYPQGVVDPVAEVAALAEARDINCHVDACMGGVTLHYLERLGEPIPAWNFAVPGVTSISVDLHKYGYTAKGAGVIVHRDKQRRNDQTFVTDNWLGGLYGSSGVLGTKSGGAIAAAWAVMHHLGGEGYLRLTAAARRACLQLADAVAATPGLELRARPDTTLLSFGATPESGIDVMVVADELWRRGWYVDRQGPPPSLHCTVNAVHDGLIEEFVAALHDSIRAASSPGESSSPRPPASGAYATLE